VFEVGSLMAPSRECLWLDSTVTYRGFRLDVVNRLSTLNGAPSSQVQRMMRHKHYGTTEHYVRGGAADVGGAEGKITKI
jgi:hypothetical protein